jgi:hypothetical protein
MILYNSDKLDFYARHFNSNEIEKESENNSFVMTSKLLETLEGCDILREEIGQPLVITDGCRFDGSKTSQHYFKQFNALDIWTDSYSSEELMKIVEDLDLFTGRGLYPASNGFIHVDCRRGLYPNKTGNRVSRWYRDGNGDYHNYGQHYTDKPFDGLLG